MCWLGDWIRLIHPMHWFQSLLRSSRRLKPQISHGFLASFEGFPDASPGVLQVWENVGIQVIMGLSTGIPMARKTPTPDHGSIKGYSKSHSLTPFLGHGFLGPFEGWLSGCIARRLASMGKRWDTGDHGSINGPLQDLWENVGLQVITFLPFPTSLSGATPLATSSHP